MSSAGDTRKALIVDPNPERAKRLTTLSEQCAFTVSATSTCDEAWPRFAEMRPRVVLAGLEEGDSTAESFLRKLQTQYMGAMPRVYFVGRPEDMESTVLRPEGLLVPPLSQEVLTRVLRPELEIGDTAARQINRLRELYELTILSNDLASAIDVVVSRTSLTFRCDNCLIWGPGGESFWPRSARALGEDERERTIAHCQGALTAGITTVRGSGDRVRTYLAAPLGSGATRGGICLIVDGCRVFSPEEMDALRVLGRRLSQELTFVTAHLRLLATHNRLRESALIDPLLSVWTRAAFERAVVRQISSSRRRSEPVHLAVFDFVRLRSINDRYGHLAGDAVLAHFARTVRDGLRAQDSVGRFGGDELAVLLVGSDSEGARVAVEKLIEQLEQTPLVVDDLRLPMEVTVGLTRILPDEVSGERAFSRALAARNRARRAQKKLEVSTPQELGENGTGETSLVFDASAYAGIPTGSTIGGMYRVLHEISRGAMGVVYRGEDLGLGRPVAIKVLRSDLASDRSLVTRFREEAAVLASLQHRNLVQVYAFGEDGDDVFFVMELVEGQPLSDVIDHLIASETAISSEAALKIVDEIAEALEAIHHLGMIHRDVKPANILLDRINDRAVLVDVGVAKRATEISDAAGTPGYAAPESFTETPESSATDVYGLATTTYAMLTGRPPFGGGEILAVVNQQLFDPIEPPSSHRAELPEQVDAVMLKALDPDPLKRYQSATAFSISLARALAKRNTESQRMAAIRDQHVPNTTSAAIAERAQTISSLPDFEMPEITMPTIRQDDINAELANATEIDHPSAEAEDDVELARRRAMSTQPPMLSADLHSRGAFFAIARKLLIHQLGAAAVESLMDSSNLAELLDPNIRQSGWFPTAGLVELLTAAGTRAIGGRDKLAQRLGRSVISATLAHLFGADPASVAPSALLSASASFWPRYHNWGELEVSVIDAGSSTITLLHPAPSPVVCELTIGMIGRIPQLAGATEITIEHPECEGRGDSRCRFDVTWL